MWHEPRTRAFGACAVALLVGWLAAPSLSAQAPPTPPGCTATLAPDTVQTGGATSITVTLPSDAGRITRVTAPTESGIEVTTTAPQDEGGLRVTLDLTEALPGRWALSVEGERGTCTAQLVVAAPRPAPGAGPRVNRR